VTFFLDTNVCVYLLKGEFPRIRERLRRLRPAQVKIPAPVHAELWYGAARSAQRDRTLRELAEFLRPYEIVAFDQDAAEIQGQIRAELELAGKPIGLYDSFIAATVLAHDGILVTHNTREFRRVKHLRWEDWTK